MAYHLRPARSTGDIGAVRALFEEYAGWLSREHGVDLAFQGFADEVSGLPGKYAPPSGELIVAWANDQEAAGCVAIRQFQDDTCEVKRLFVRAAARGAGLGRELASAAIGTARALGYKRAVLDTASFMQGAARVYESLGFREIAPYYDNPYAREGGFTVRFLGADL